MILESLQSRVVHCDDAVYHGGTRDTNAIDTIVFHTTMGHSAAEAREWDNRKHSDNPASYHYVIDRDGQIYRTVPVNVVAWHAGESAIPPVPQRPIPLHLWINHRSIGIAFAGDIDKPVDLLHATEAQLCSAFWLGKLIRAQYSNICNVYGHREIAPGRKYDPRADFLLMPWFRWALAQPALSYNEMWSRYCARHTSIA